MTKLMAIPNKNNIDKILQYTDSILVGLEDYSINFNNYFNIEEIKELAKKTELFVALNKNMHTIDLDNLKKILIELNKLDIKGIFYYDISIVNIKKELNLDIDLVWSQEHLTTNYATINFWQEYGANYTYISPDITLDEILEIRKNTNNKLIVPILGYLPMFVSERHIVKNYIKYFNLNNNSKINYLEKEDKKYPIVDEDSGTTVYANDYLNGYKEYLKLIENNIEYVTLNEFEIDENIFIEILKIFKNKDNNGEEQIDQLLENTSKHFLHKETIYKVKNNG